MQENDNNNLAALKSVYLPLIFGGCLPFVIAALAPYFGIFDLPIIGNIQMAIAYYSLALASFMAGVQWGVSLSQRPEKLIRNNHPICPKQLMLASNGMVLIPWFTLTALGPGITFYFMIALTFLLLMVIDYRLANRNIVTHDYCKVRIAGTGIVVLSLISLAFTT